MQIGVIGVTVTRELVIFADTVTGTTWVEKSSWRDQEIQLGEN